MNSHDSMKERQLIYSLGSGCWCHAAIPRHLRSPSVFNQGGDVRGVVFMPQTLFDGRLRRKFFDAGSWSLKIMKHRPDDGEAIYDAQADIDEFGFRIGHINLNTVHFRQLNDIAAAEAMFKFFEDNKRRQLFIIDFSRGAYAGYSNEMVLEFEKFLAGEGFDLRNFIYCDVDQRQVPGRFDGCGAKVFSYDNSDSDYMELGMFRCVRKMFDTEKPYLDETLRRISGEDASFLELLGEDNRKREA